MYKFEPITNTEEQLTLLLSWFQNPHVANNWDRIPTTVEETRKKYEEKINNPKVFPYIIYIDATPIGFIQSYEAFETKDGWWKDQPEGTWGIDLFIGEEIFLGKGHGSEIVKKFAKNIFAEKRAKKIIIDPEPDNTRAIRAYEKAGFSAVGEITTPDGIAFLMEQYPS